MTGEFSIWVICTTLNGICISQGGFGIANITLVDELETEQIIDSFRIPTVPIIFVIGKKNISLVKNL